MRSLAPEGGVHDKDNEYVIMVTIWEVFLNFPERSAGYDNVLRRGDAT